MAGEITVFVPTFGTYEGLAQTLSSVVSQSCPINRIVVSDDGSGKRFPADLMQRFPRVYFRQGNKNLGTVAHMNFLATSIDTQFLKFLAAGDSFANEESLAALVGFAKKHNAYAVTSQAMVCTDDLKRRLYPFPLPGGMRVFAKPPQQLFEALAIKNQVSAVGTLFSRDFFTQLGGFDESFRLLEDWPTWLRLAREGHSIPMLAKVTCLYAMGGISSVSGDAFCSERLREDMILCYEKEILPYAAAFSYRARQEIAYGYARAQGRTAEDLMKEFQWLERKRLWKQHLKRVLTK